MGLFPYTHPHPFPATCSPVAMSIHSYYRRSLDPKPFPVPYRQPKEKGGT